MACVLACMIFDDKCNIERSAYVFTMGVLVCSGLHALLVLRVDYGWEYLLLLAIATFGSDTGAYFAGMAFGKHKLIPRLSPKKTIEGAIGGALSGAIFGTGYITLLTFLLEPACEYQIRFLNIESNVWYLIAIFGIALIVSIAGQLGDLVASKLKREYEIKDYGKIFPGHGGVLDRFDSTILGGLVFYIIIFIIGVI